MTATLTTFANEQVLDEPGLRGRLTSSSYAPKPGDPVYRSLVADLGAVFRAHAKDGRFVLAYDTLLWCGPLG